MVVAGGDGTIGVVLRALADTECQVALLPLGTFNNFARALRIPEDVDGAIEVAGAPGRTSPDATAVAARSNSAIAMDLNC